MIAKLTIQTFSRDGITCLSQNYCTPPFKIANITEDKQAGILHLMIMNSSPGTLDNDDYTMQIDIDENCFLYLHTQSYQRLFNMKKGARQLVQVQLKKNASLFYLPHPAVPHENSNFTSINKIHLMDSSTLVWGEILTCGRKLNGEVFRFSRYQNITEIFLNNQLVVKDNLLMQPAVIDPVKTGQLEGFTHQASLIIFKNSGTIQEYSDKIHDHLVQSGIEFGISETQGYGLIIRMLGHAAEPLYQCLQHIAVLMQQQSLIKPVKPVYAD